MEDIEKMLDDAMASLDRIETKLDEIDVIMGGLMSELGIDRKSSSTLNKSTTSTTYDVDVKYTSK